MQMLRSRVTRRRAVPTLLALALLAGCGGDDDQNASSPPPATTAEAPATTAPPAETAPPTETQPQEQTETTPAPEEPATTTEKPAEEPAESPAADPDAGEEAGLDGAAEAAAASLKAQISGDYAAVKRLVSKRCGKQVTKASVEQMKTAFDTLSKQAAGTKLDALVKELSTADGWKVERAGKNEAKVTAADEAGFADYYFIRENGVWKDNTCAHDGSATSS